MTRLQQVLVWVLWKIESMGVFIDGVELKAEWIPIAKKINKESKPDRSEIDALLIALLLEKRTFRAKDAAAVKRFNRSKDFAGIKLGG